MKPLSATNRLLAALAWLALLVVAGFGAGLIGYITGLASIVSYPALLAVGLSPIAANVTNTVALVAVGVGSTAQSGRSLLDGDRRRLIIGAIASLIGGTVGAVLLLSTPAEAFEAVEEARGNVSLTYFEFGTLAAFVAFADADLDDWVLEVGLGGRLDAVNLVDADCAIVTSVAIDHAQWLGNDRETIALEKAHIFRPDRPAICSDPQPPQSLVRHAEEIGAELEEFLRTEGGEE